MLAGHLRRHGPRVAVLASLVGLAVAVAALAALVDVDALIAGAGRAASDPVGVALATGAFAGAFALRAVAWTRVLPSLGVGHSLSALHVSLGANHVLPLRLGEPLRIVSAVRRAGVDARDATASTVVLRSADVLVLLALGALVGPRTLWDLLGVWGGAAVVGVAVLGAVAAAVLVRRGSVGGLALASRPGPVALALTTLAWLAEAVVVWQVARWFGIDLAAHEAVLVLAAAVSAQLVAIAPGGIGTYEAAASTALIAVGVDASSAFTVAVGLHAAKTAYSLLGGGVACIVPAPTLFGRFRLPRPTRDASPTPNDPGPGPVVLFLPARDEGPRIEAVIERAPATVCGRPVDVVVVDDASSDDTATVASAAGATVVSHDAHRGLGAAVRTGLAHATARGACAVAFCDADGEYDPAELGALVGPILHGDADYVVGNRFTGDRGRMLPHRWLGNRMLTRWVRLMTRHPVDDGQSGYRALSGRAAAEAEVAHDYNYAQVLTVDLLARGYRYHEVPITYAFRTSGRSFVRLGTYLSRVVPTVWRQLNDLPSPLPSTSIPSNTGAERRAPAPTPAP